MKLSMMSYTWSRTDPWKSQFAFNANGDGTLWYPGTVDRIGGTHDIPVSSIRLKMIREGIEDTEYLYLLASLKGKEEAVKLCREIAKKPEDWDHDPVKLMALREQIASEIEDALAKK